MSFGRFHLAPNSLAAINANVTHSDVVMILVLTVPAASCNDKTNTCFDFFVIIFFMAKYIDSSTFRNGILVFRSCHFKLGQVNVEDILI